MSKTRRRLQCVVWLALPAALLAKEHAPRPTPLENYLQRVQTAARPAVANSAGSLWQDHGRMSDLTSDYKAARVGDVLAVLVVQDLTAQNSGTLATQRDFKTAAGVTGLAGHIPVSGVQNAFAANSSTTLNGKAQAASQSSLRTSLSGRVVAVLEGGTLVVEAERSLVMNNERQTIVLRGLVRPGDISADNSVLSNQMGNLELELKGRGALSDGTRPVAPWTRILLRLVGF
jgi:flagellar L-ring protein precursor FlgH